MNPLQFECIMKIIQKYPRTLEDDLRCCEREGVDIVFAPDDEQMYGLLGKLVLKVGSLSTIFEGKNSSRSFRWCLSSSV